MSKRITDKRFLHLVGQFLKAGYVEDWRYHQTYTGTPQGGNLSPILSNIYLNELDQMVTAKAAEWNRGKVRKVNKEYHRVNVAVSKAKQKARQTGNWEKYKALQRRMLKLQPADPQDPDYRRLTFVRYADDWLVGVIGSKTDAIELKAWLEEYLRNELQLELSAEKTLITNSKKRVRFLGYDIQRNNEKRIYRYRTTKGIRTQRTSSHKMRLLMPRDKTIAFSKAYGDTSKWRGNHRNHLVRFSELEILMTYNAEVRGFLGYYSLADNLTDVAGKVLKITTGSFMRTVAKKRQSTFRKVSRSMKRGPGLYVYSLKQEGKPVKEYELVASTRQIIKGTVNYGHPDLIPVTWQYKSRTELGQRLLAHECEWCGTQQGQMEVHHVRKLKDVKGKSVWERQMIERRRKTMVLCVTCHDELHAGKLSEKTKKLRESGRAGYAERCKVGSEGSTVKPSVETC